MRLPSTVRAGASTLLTSTQQLLRAAASGALPLGLLALAGSTASAAMLTFGTPTQISGDADVSNAGTTDLATYFNANGGGTSQTVNGVTFQNTLLDTESSSGGPIAQPVTSPTTGGYSATFTSSNDVNQFPGFTSFSAPYASLSTSYKAILGGGLYVSSAPLSLTLNGLNAGTSYQLQFFVEDPRNTSLGTRSETLTAGNTSAALLFGHGNGTGFDGDGATGTYILATFTADNTTQNIEVDSFSQNIVQINALSLQTVVPEPSTYCLLGLTVAGFAAWSLRRSRPQAA